MRDVIIETWKYRGNEFMLPKLAFNKVLIKNYFRFSPGKFQIEREVWFFVYFFSVAFFTYF